MNFGHQTIKIDPDGTIRCPECDYESKHTLLTKNKEYIMTKTSGGSHWAGIGSRKYHSPEIRVFKILKTTGENNFIAEEVISCEIKHKRKE